MTTDDRGGGGDELSYQPGDHVGVFAGNDPEVVDAVLQRLTLDAPDPDQVAKMEILKEKRTPLGEWIEGDQGSLGRGAEGCMLVGQGKTAPTGEKKW